ncbi:MAG: hypothetical protein RIT25_2382 [Planctomycetota bacterium]|jgi:hypothetical protein
MRVGIRLLFGVKGRAPVERSVDVPEGSTVVDATRAAVEVVQDKVCCSPEDVWAIDGITTDAARGRYWFWLLNGRPGPDMPYRHVLRDGDVVEWRYN